MTASIHIELTAQTVEEALQQLIDDIDKIETAPSNPEENPDNDDPFFDERARIMATVAAVARFMQSLPELDREERLRPLVTLLAALIDVQDGRKSKLLSPDRKRGRKMPPLGEQYARAIAAAAMEFFTRIDGVINEEAARRVARWLDNNGKDYLFTDDSEPYTQVERWREKVIPGPESPYVDQHYQILVAWGDTSGLGPEQTAKKLLKLLS